MPEQDATTTEAPDEVLLFAIARGDGAALGQFYRRHRNQVYRFAWAISRSAPIAEDATQDAFLSVIENASRFDPRRGNGVAWLLGCARNKVVDRLRQMPVDAPEGDETGSSEDHGLNEELRRRRDALHAAITALPLAFREVVVLCELQEFSYADAAIILDCPLGTVRSRLARARVMLRNRLVPHLQPETTDPICLALGQPGNP
jgi:RNA polymerase sigma-70 factor (ECF subfamily)